MSEDEIDSEAEVYDPLNKRGGRWDPTLHDLCKALYTYVQVEKESVKVEGVNVKVEGENVKVEGEYVKVGDKNVKVGGIECESIEMWLDLSVFFSL